MFPVKFAMGYAYGSDFIPITPNKNAIWWAGLGWAWRVFLCH